MFRPRHTAMDDRPMTWASTILEAIRDGKSLGTCLKRREVQKFLLEATGRYYAMPTKRGTWLKTYTPLGVLIKLKWLGRIVEIDVYHGTLAPGQPIPRDDWGPQPRGKKPSPEEIADLNALAFEKDQREREAFELQREGIVLRGAPAQFGGGQI